MSKNDYKRAFDALYRASTPETRALFDKPSTRDRAGVLYTVWQEYQTAETKVVKARAAPSRLETSSQGIVGDFNDFLFCLDMMGAICAISTLEKEGMSKEEAITYVAENTPPGAFRDIKPSRRKSSKTKK